MPRLPISRILLLTATAAALALPAPAAAEEAVGITGGFFTPTAVARFDTATPDVASRRIITGTTVGADLFTPVALDVRPATGVAYFIATAPGTAAANDGIGRLFTLDIDTAVAVPVGTPFSSTLAEDTIWGMDFNPVADRIRLTGSNGTYLRLIPETGAPLPPDPMLSGGMAAFSITAVAYDRSVAGATTTTLFGIDDGNDRLVRIGGVDGSPSANGGVITDIGALGTDVSSLSGHGPSFDISEATGTFYLAGYATGGLQLLTVNPQTGAATSVGMAEPLVGFSLLRTSRVQVSAEAVTVGEGAAGGAVAITVTRTGDTSHPATVRFATAAGTATAGTDYTDVDGTLAFAPGVASRTVQVPVADDALVEAAETFTFTLSAPTGTAVLGAAPAATVTISSDDVTAPADTTKPFVLLLPPGTRTLPALRRSGLPVTFSMSEASSATLVLRSGARVLSKATFTFTSAGVTRVVLRPTRTSLKVVSTALAPRRVTRTRLQLTLTVTDAAGNARVTKAVATVTG